MSFTHLHVRSGYSLMESTITIEKLVKKASDLQFTSLALTDEHVLYGAIEFYQTCLKYDIKPLIGMTVTIHDDSYEDSCILLAKNNEGFKELTDISTYLNVEQAKSVDIEKLRPLTSNLVCILRPSDGQVSNLIREQRFDEAYTYVQKWQSMFSEEDLYLGIQDHNTSTDRSHIQMVKAF